jgi:fatty acid desaturase
MASSSSSSSLTADRLLYGSQDVPLAPVRGVDTRRDLPKSMFTRRPVYFTAKLVFSLALIAAGCVAIAITPVWPVDIPVVIVIGLMYAHLVELQHECLHEHAYNQRWLNRLVGFICGIPMMSSFWHYKYEHLRHHAYLGTPQNREFFNYRFRNLDSIPGFLRSCFHLGRYQDVGVNIGRSLLGGLNPRVTKTLAAKKIRTEYVGFAVVLAGTVAASAATSSLLLLVAWVAPTLLVAEPTHFLIELPEHFGLNSQTDPNVLSNTRTVRASRFGRWFTNGNDLHTAHHFHQGVPMARVPELHELIESRIGTIEPSYWSFYRKVIKGELRYQDLADTCMTR